MSHQPWRLRPAEGGLVNRTYIGGEASRSCALLHARCMGL